MGFRFRRSIRILPGIRLNLSGSGVSTSIGGRGATINVGRRGVRGTVGLPGTGLSYSETLMPFGGNAASHHEAHGPGASPFRSGWARVLVAVLGVVALAVAGLILVSWTISEPRTEAGGAFESRSTSMASVAAPTVDRASESPSAIVGAHVVGTVNCRANPNARAGIVAKLVTGDRLAIVDQQGGWTRVTSGDRDCWMSSGLVRG